MSTNIIKENLQNNNLIRVVDGEYSSASISVTVTNGRIKCIGNTGENSETITIPIINKTINGIYNFSMQNINSSNCDYPTVFLDDILFQHITQVYGTANQSYANIDVSNDTVISKIKISCVSNSKFDFEFDLMLQEGCLRKRFIPYDSTTDTVNLITDINDNVVRPYTFGAVGDGVTDDTAALQASIDYALANNKKIILDGGCTYLISKTLNILGSHLWFDGQGATIKVDSNVTPVSNSNGIYKIINAILINTNADLVYDVPKENGISLYNKSTYICRVFKNLTVDCNEGIANCGILVEKGGKTHFTNIMVCDPASYGIKFSGGSEAVFDNVHFTRSRVKDRIVQNDETIHLNCDSVGLTIDASDIYIHDCVTIDFKTGFRITGSDNHFCRCHSWNAYTQNIISESIGFDVAAGYSTFSQCTVDSERYGWVLRGSAIVFMSNCCNTYSSLYVDNKTVYGEPVLFYFDDNHILKGAGLSISTSNLKPKENLVCHFDNLCSDDAKIIIDKMATSGFVDVHISEALRN